MRRRLAGRVAVVTGASGGVGRAVARALGAEGVRVALLARNGEALERAAREIRDAGDEAAVEPRHRRLEIVRTARLDAVVSTPHVTSRRSPWAPPSCTGRVRGARVT